MDLISEKPTVMVIDEWLPYPCNTGKKIRSYNLLKNLSSKFNIIFLAYADQVLEQDSIKHLEELGITVESVDDDRIPKGSSWYWLKVVINIFSNNPFAAVYHYTKAFRQKFRESITHYRPSIIHCEWTFYARYIPDCNRIPIIISAHNVEYQQWERVAETTRNPLKKVFSRLQADKIKRFEITNYQKAVTCLVVSEKDRKFMEMHGARAVLVENGVDTDFFSEKFQEFPERGTCVTFAASMDAFSNQDAAIYFMKDILPLIQMQRPDAEFLIVGKSPPTSLLSYAKRCHNVKLTGTVDDVRPYVRSAVVNVVPLRVGGGTRLKILESMAMGKAVVSTSVGYEGLDLEADRHLLVADTPKDFADKVLMLMTDSKLRKTIAHAGCDHVLLRYAWKPMAAIMDNVWREALENPSSHGSSEP